MRIGTSSWEPVMIVILDAATIRRAASSEAGAFGRIVLTMSVWCQRSSFPFDAGNTATCGWPAPPARSE